MIRIENLNQVKAMVYGGAFYGGGGGGWIDDGIKYAQLALELGGSVEIREPNEVSNDSILVTVSAVGAPAAKERYMKPIHLIRSVELLIESGIRVDGLIPSEVGAFNGVNGWIQSVSLGIPVIDIPCNGRAHPMGVMGSMGLHRIKDYVSIQSAVGGNPATGRYLELVVVSRLEIAARLIRRAAEEAGGIVAVARNPIEASYAKRNGAPGALRKAMEVGEVITKYIEIDPKEASIKAIETAGGEVIDECELISTSLETRGGFDIGYIRLKGREISKYTITFFNEYMTLDLGQKRLATFPDLIVLMSIDNGLPITSAEASKYVNKKVVLGVVSKEKLILGSGVKFAEVYNDLEKILGVKMKEYLEEFLIH